MSMPTPIPKFQSNEYIEEFAEGAIVYGENLKKIVDICLGEGSRKSNTGGFSDEKAIEFDKVAWAMKTDGNRSADLVTIIGKKTLLIADAKFRSKTGSDVQQKPEKVREKYQKTREILMENPKFQDMSLSFHERMIVVFPELKNFPQIERKLRQLTEKPKIAPFTLSGFYKEFFNTQK